MDIEWQPFSISIIDIEQLSKQIQFSELQEKLDEGISVDMLVLKNPDRFGVLNTQDPVKQKKYF